MKTKIVLQNEITKSNELINIPVGEFDELKNIIGVKDEFISIRVSNFVGEISNFNFSITESFKDYDNTKPIQDFRDTLFNPKMIKEISGFVSANKMLGHLVKGITLQAIMK